MKEMRYFNLNLSKLYLSLTQPNLTQSPNNDALTHPPAAPPDALPDVPPDTLPIVPPGCSNKRPAQTLRRMPHQMPRQTPAGRPARCYIRCVTKKLQLII